MLILRWLSSNDIFANENEKKKQNYKRNDDRSALLEFIIFSVLKVFFYLRHFKLDFFYITF